MSYPRAFSHIGLSIPNIEQAVKFYGDVMGWYVIMEPSTVKEFGQAFDIYEYSFPEYEKRYLQDQINAMQNEQYHFDVIKNGKDDVAGFIFSWQTKDYVYVEHFAIAKNERGKNLGSSILTEFIKSFDIPVILEIDPPTDDISIRRLNFYNKIGFVLLDVDFIHPSYRINTSPHILKILSTPKVGQDIIDKFLSYLYSTVMYYSATKK